MWVLFYSSLWYCEFVKNKDIDQHTNVDPKYPWKKVMGIT